MFRTDDGGLSWQNLSSYPTPYAHSIQVHPEDARTVYVGSEPAAIFRSRDGGESWEECAGFRMVTESNEWFFHSETRQSHVRDLRIAPDDPRYMYAGIEVGGVVRSRDGGEIWQQSPGTDADVHLISLSAARPNTVYVATASGPYRSDDAGASWELINNGLQRSYAVHISPSPDDADLVLVSVSSSFQRQHPHFYRSTTGGSHWQKIGSVGSDDDMVVAVDWDPSEAGRVYAGTEGGKVYQSEDHGTSWEPLPVGLPNIAVGAFAVAPS